MSIKILFEFPRFFKLKKKIELISVQTRGGLHLTEIKTGCIFCLQIDGPTTRWAELRNGDSSANDVGLKRAMSCRVSNFDIKT